MVNDLAASFRHTEKPDIVTRNKLMLIRIGEVFNLSVYRDLQQGIDNALNDSLERFYFDFRGTHRVDASSLPMLFYFKYKLGKTRLSLIHLDSTLLQNMGRENVTRYFSIVEKEQSEHVTVEFMGDIVLFSLSLDFTRSARTTFYREIANLSAAAERPNYLFLDFRGTEYYDNASLAMLFHARSELPQNLSISLVDFRLDLLRSLNLEEFRKFFRILRQGAAGREALTETILRSSLESSDQDSILQHT